MENNKWRERVAGGLIAVTVGGYLEHGEPPALSSPPARETCDTILATNTATTTTTPAPMIVLNAPRLMRPS
jgi:hypothetical protein